MNTNVYRHFKIMVVDDNDIMREVLCVLLKNAGYDVVAEANDGDVGLSLAAQVKPDILFLDVVMPRMGGLDMLADLKQNFPDCVILMVTSDSDADSVRTALALGAAGYVLKPYRSQTVLGELEAALLNAGKLPIKSANASVFPRSGSA